MVSKTTIAVLLLLVMALVRLVHLKSQLAFGSFVPVVTGYVFIQFEELIEGSRIFEVAV